MIDEIRKHAQFGILYAYFLIMYIHYLVFSCSAINSLRPVRNHQMWNTLGTSKQEILMSLDDNVLLHLIELICNISPLTVYLYPKVNNVNRCWVLKVEVSGPLCIEFQYTMSTLKCNVDMPTCCIKSTAAIVPCTIFYVFGIWGFQEFSLKIYCCFSMGSHCFLCLCV